MLRPYVEIYNTLTSLIIVVALLAVIYAILMTNLPMIMKVKHILLGISFCVYFYLQCNLGNKFNVMNEAIQNQVYDLPWYCLPSKQRKLVYIFLCQVQHPIKFRAFQVYPVDRQTFPRVLKLTYSIANVTHSMLNSRG